MEGILTIVFIIAGLYGWKKLNSNKDKKDNSENDWNPDDYLPDDSDSENDKTDDVIDDVIIDYQNELLSESEIKSLPTRKVLARTLYGEGRGLPDNEVYHIGEVIINRKNIYKFPNTIKNVCLQKMQFSCWNSLYLDVLKDNHKTVRKRNILTERFDDMLEIADDIIYNNFARDLPFETYYYFIPESTDIIRDKIIVDTNDNWKEGLKLVHKDSKHYFFKEWL